jgi:nucleotidyltransferase/DNA polymerase involved in DNA repair
MKERDMLDIIVWTNPVLKLCGIGKVETKTLREMKIETRRAYALRQLDVAVLVDTSQPVQAVFGCDEAAERFMKP